MLNRIKLLLLLFFCGQIHFAASQSTVARQWNEVLLEGIRNDKARPTVHARNLFHISAAMYDAWAVFDEEATTYLLGKTVHGFTSDFTGFTSSNISSDRDKAISYAVMRLLEHRFAHSPDWDLTEVLIEEKMLELGYDINFSSTDYTSGSAAALGNYVASQYISYGLQDGANEGSNQSYSIQYYEPYSDSLFLEQIAIDSIQPWDNNEFVFDPNKWQPLAFSNFIDQSGNPEGSSVPKFVGPEWGRVAPFALKESDLTIHQRDGHDWWVYNDPGPPPHWDPNNDSDGTSLYQWNYSLVAIWSGHLDSSLEEEIDISPASIGNYNLSNIPAVENYDTFYGYLSGGDASEGRTQNPITGQPYTPQLVKRGDYGRILAEFWADGPDSETPPGHWFTILNYVNDNLSQKKLNGQGDVLDDLEWDVKTYFLLGGTMHDVAISVWGIKGYYDYVRPVSAIRYMSYLGQSSDSEGTNYHPGGMPLVEGHIEQITLSDPAELRGKNDENVGEIKIYAWRGPGPSTDPFIENPETDIAGVDWILGTQWWPYQRPSFVSPPFAGYVSGHSTFSRAAAELLTLITGTPYFPNGMGIFDAPEDEFLVFEDGPSIDIELQWATYRDASDQCSLSRIWGGIHPPIDDIPGRIIGEKMGKASYEQGIRYFTSDFPLSAKKSGIIGLVYPNPFKNVVNIKLPKGEAYEIKIWDFQGKKMRSEQFSSGDIQMDINNLKSGKYILTIRGNKWESSHFIIKE